MGELIIDDSEFDNLSWYSRHTRFAGAVAAGADGGDDNSGSGGGVAAAAAAAAAAATASGGTVEFRLDAGVWDPSRRRRQDSEKQRSAGAAAASASEGEYLLNSESQLELDEVDDCCSLFEGTKMFE